MATISVFISYSHNDEALWDLLAKHLKVLQREGVIKTWYDRKIQAGKEWAKEIDSNLKRARIILLMVSADFIASDYCYEIEVRQAMKLHDRGQCQVIPIILRPCNWTKTPFGKLQALPKAGRPVTDWENRDAAFADITRSIRDIAINLGAVPISKANLLTRFWILLSKLKGRTIVFIIAVTFFAMFVIHGLIAPQIAIGLIENSALKTATHYLKISRWLAFFNIEVDTISNRLNEPFHIEASLIVKRSDKPIQDKLYPFNASKDSKIALTPKDYYKVIIEMNPSRMFLYIYETEMDYGHVSRLFPPELSMETSALVQNKSIINVPDGVNRWRQLTEHSESTATTITIHLLATPWRAKDIESVYQEIDRRLQSDKLSIKERKMLVTRLLSRIDARVDSHLNCFFYSHLSFQHTN